jgi:threonine dehydratase
MTAWACPNLADVFRARAAIAPYLRPTPILESAALDDALGCRAVLKCENLNPTGAFKVRGGLNLLASMTPEERARGLVTASTGNHGLSIAFAAQRFGAPATVYVPEGSNTIKLAAIRALGAQLVVHGRDFEASRQAAERHPTLRYIHSANEPLLVAGVGTCALELLEAAPDIEVLIVPIGGGSGVLGAGVVARAVNPALRVIGVQAIGAPAVYRAWREGRVVETDSVQTFAEGLATRRAFELPVSLMPRLVDDIMLVSDDELEAAIMLILQATRQVAEGAGAAAVAAAMARRDDLAGKRVGLILSGGNLPLDVLRSIVDRRGTPGAHPWPSHARSS